jgi:predicted NBD/HSP70 family sugar kinase
MKVRSHRKTPRRSVQRKNDVIAAVESALIKRVRSTNGISRVELARELNIAPSTIGTYVDRLICERFLREGAKQETAAGRPRIHVELNPEGGQFIGVDFYAERITAIAVDFAEVPRQRISHEIQPDDTPATIVEKICSAIEEVMADNARQVLGIGIGTPGPVDKAHGMATEYRYLPSFENVSLADPISHRFRQPVYLENTVNAMTLAELWFGSGKNVSDFACIGVRSGVGAGIVIDGKLHCGRANAAGEIGCWQCPVPSQSTTGPATNHLEEIASTRAIVRAVTSRLRQGKRSVLSAADGPPTIDDVIQAHQQGDGLAQETVLDAAHSLGWAAAHLGIAMEPQKIIFAGPLTALGDGLLEPVREMLNTLYGPTGLQLPTVENSTMGEFSGALGAAALVADQWKPLR